MDAEDIVEAVIAKLPIKPNPTWTERLALYAFMALMVAVGGWGGLSAKEYFDRFHAQLMGAITQNEKEEKETTDKLQAQVDKNTRDIAAIEKYFVTNAALTRWAAQFQRENGRAVPGLVVPEVPPPQAVPTN